MDDSGESVEAEGVEEKEEQEWLRRGTGMVLLSTSGSSLFHSTAFYPNAPLLVRGKERLLGKPHVCEEVCGKSVSRYLSIRKKLEQKEKGLHLALVLSLCSKNS